MQIIITLVIITVMLFLLIKEVYDPLKIFTVASTIFLIIGAISLDEAISGFSNKGVLSVAVLFILAGAIERSSYFKELTRFKDLSRENFNPLKLFSLITGFSAFLNNTPIVSIFIPITKKISDKTGISSSKLLIPISYLSVLGGMLTLIGTSTNLVVSGLMVENGLEPIGFFELTKISIIAVIIGFIYIFLTYLDRLPDNSEVLKQSRGQSNKHFVRFVVKFGCDIIGKTVKDADLRALSGVYLVEIERSGNKIFPIAPTEIILEDDVLVFAGNVNQIDELRSIENLILEPDEEVNTNFFNHDNTVILETVLTQYISSPNMTVKELKFREKYNAVIIGIIRNGECINEKIGSIQLKLGDILLLIVDKGSRNFIEKDRAFTIINSENRTVREHNKKSFYPFIAFIGTIVLTLLFGYDILFSAIIGVCFLLITNTIQIRDALNMIEYKTIILIAVSFAIGKGITNTGTASFLAKAISPIIVNTNPLVIMFVIFVITVIFTTVITNNAAAVLIVPIVYEIAEVSMLDPRPLLLITAIAASCSFLSPYAYQTNTMVYGAGGYEFKDFVRFGYPLTIIIGVCCIFSTYFIYF